MAPFGISESVWVVTSDMIIGVFVAAMVTCWAAYRQQTEADDLMMPELPLAPESWLLTIIVFVLWWKLILLFALAAVVVVLTSRE